VSHGITGTSGMEVNVAIRPEKIGIQKDAPVADDYDNSAEVGFNCVRGEIRSLAYLGSQTIYHVGLASGLMVKVTKANDARHDESRLAVGDAVHVWWWGSDVVVLTQ
jgi:putrescine transport system ATP-binding protein